MTDIITSSFIRYDDGGQRVTQCCGCYSTYMDDGAGGEVLCCKRCYNEVEFGQGDGSEFRPGVTADEYFAAAFSAPGSTSEGQRKEAT